MPRGRENIEWENELLVKENATSQFGYSAPFLMLAVLWIEIEWHAKGDVLSQLESFLRKI